MSWDWYVQDWLIFLGYSIDCPGIVHFCGHLGHHMAILETTVLFGQKIECLVSQEKLLSESMAAISRVIEFTEQCMQHSSDIEIMHVQSEIQNQIDRTREKEYKQMVHLEPAEEMNIDLKVCNVQDLELCLAKSSVMLLPVDPSKCTLRTENIGLTEINKPTKLNVITKLCNGKFTKQASVVNCYLKSLVSGSVIKCDVDKTSRLGEYQIHCLPTIRGQNQLTIKVNGQEIAESPLNFCAYLPPNELGHPVSVIEDLNTPHGIAVNSSREIIVTEWSGSVVTLTKGGKVIKRTKRSDFNRLTGVAVDSDDNVYIADNKLNWIFKFNKNMELLKKVKHSYSSSGLYGITVIGDKVMVCEKNRHIITVYDTNLHPQRQIEAQAFMSSQSGLFDLSGDDRGNMFVSHYGNRRVQVFNNEGNILRSFDLSAADSKSYPSGLCVAGLYVYVANETRHKVCVYTTEGEFVTSFGQWGTKKGEFYTPCGVCVRDSYVYVCDRYNNRVQIF